MACWRAHVLRARGLPNPLSIAGRRQDFADGAGPDSAGADGADTQTAQMTPVQTMHGALVNGAKLTD